MTHVLLYFSLSVLLLSSLLSTPNKKRLKWHYRPIETLSNAEGGTRTPTPLRAQRPERCVSTNFTTSALYLLTRPHPHTSHLNSDPHLDLDTHYNTVSLPTCQEFFSPLLLFHPHQNTYGTNGPPSLTVNPDTSTLVTGGSIETIASSHQKHEQLGSTTGRISLTLVGEDW